MSAAPIQAPGLVDSLYRDIAFHAKTRPDAVAVTRGPRDVTYAEFRADIDNFTRAIARQQLPAGSLVAVTASVHYMHWLIVISLARLGFASVSVDPRQLDVSSAKVWITDKPSGETDGIRVIVPDGSWTAAPARGQALFQDRPVPADTPARVVLSSGTTGTPKRAIFTYLNFRTRYRNAALSYGVNARSRFLTMVAPTTVAGWAFPAATWCVGGTVVLMGQAPRRPIGEIVAALEPTIVFCSPAQLAGLVETWPQKVGRQDGLTVFVGGAPLPQAVNEQARERITPSLKIIYGSTEASTITMCDASSADGKPGFVGHTVVYAQVEIVDETDKPLGVGETGIIRTRGDGMALRYLDDPDTTAQCFRDGWFYPGDTGSLDKAGALTVQGRVSELINLGGTKIAPDVIDELMAQVPGVKEAAAFGAVTDGREELWIAIVPGEGLDEKALARQFRERFPRYPRPKVVRVRELPRNEMRKVMRAQLRDRVMKAVKRGA